MNEIERYQEPAVGQEVLDWQVPPTSEGQAASDLVGGIARRWYIVLLVFLLLTAAGAPAIWLLVKPEYEVVGAVRVAPVQERIIDGTADPGEISDYERFMNTEAEKITSNAVVQRVADDLVDKKLTYFEKKPLGLIEQWQEKLLGPSPEMDPALKLKRAIVGSKRITVAADKKQELIKVSMLYSNPEEAKQIVNAFLKAYMDIEVVSAGEDENRQLGTLESSRERLAGDIKNYRKQIVELAKEDGKNDDLEQRRALKQQRLADLQSEIMTAQGDRLKLESEVKLLERTKQQPLAQEQLLDLRQRAINEDPAVSKFAEDVTELERELIDAKQKYADTNPEIGTMTRKLERLQERLKELKQEVGEAFDTLIAKQAAETGDRKLAELRNRLDQAKEYEQSLRDAMQKEDAENIRLGGKQLEIEELQANLKLTEDRYETVLARIQDLELLRKRPARISICYQADIASINDKRVKFTAALIFGAFVLGAGLAYLRDRADQRLRTPDDVAKRIGIRIIGTTTSLDTVKPALLPEQIVGDYQTIRANLKLLGGNKIPRKLVVTSPGMREGKTTFAVNLATSMAESGLKVLLIDGDLRKPDVARLLNLPEGSRGLQDVLCGVKLEQAVYSVAATGLDVLAADFTDATEAYEMLAQPSMARIINMISRKYDHVIVDTPPVLGFPDALMWAKIGDAAILVSYAGHTTMPDLREAKERLAQIGVKVLGTVLSSVQAGHGYYRHGHSYYAQVRDSARVSRRKLMFSVEEDQEQDVGDQAEDSEPDMTEEDYSYSDSTQSRKTVSRSRKRASAAKGSGNNESARADKKTPKKGA
jgi:succinoglycan biosynthesis transport protein ExoP